MSERETSPSAFSWQSVRGALRETFLFEEEEREMDRGDCMPDLAGADDPDEGFVVVGSCGRFSRSEPRDCDCIEPCDCKPAYKSLIFGS